MNEYQYVITTDSGCDLPADLLMRRGVTAVPMTYMVGGEKCSDGMDEVSRRKFYELLESGAPVSLSTAESANLKTVWGKCAEKGIAVLHVASGSRQDPGAENCARAEKELREEYPGWEMRCVFSDTCSAGCGLLILTAVELKERGCCLRECAGALEALRGNVVSVAMGGDRKRLRRETGLDASVWEKLPLAPREELYLADEHGHYRLLGHLFGKKSKREAFSGAVCRFAAAPSTQTLYIAHSNCLCKAVELGNLLKMTAGFRDVFYTNIGSHLGVRTGGGFVGAFFVGKSDPGRKRFGIYGVPKSRGMA